MGLATGAFGQIIDGALIVPALMNRFHGHHIWAENVPTLWSWVAHAVFGLAFLLFIPIRQRMSGPRSPSN